LRLKLIVQIPCFNERELLAGTLADLPRSLPGIDRIEVLIIDDGSTDGTAELAEALGVHHLVRFARNRGLAAAYMAGLDACLRLGADFAVNTDADNQYAGEDIAQLVEPIQQGRADLVVGDRGTDQLAHFSWAKRLLQRWGSRLMCRASGVQVGDSTSGFRAMNRKAMRSLFTHSRFSYTLETIIQAGRLGLVVENVVIRARPVSRPSRLFNSIPEYLRRNGPVILRSYAMYWPGQTFGFLALVFLGVGIFLVTRFLYYYLLDPNVSSHVQSLQIGVGSVVLAFVIGLMAYLGDLIAANRRLTEEILNRVRRIDAELESLRVERKEPEGIHRTGAPPWTLSG
jgi:glycosyltransferase involved in cell wall biosynthesis